MDLPLCPRLWHEDPGRGPLTLLALDLDTPAVIGHDALSDEETPVGRADAVFCDVKRGIEKVGNPIGSDAYSRVSDL